MNFLLRTLLLAMSLLVASVVPSVAHPLGNFTINHLTKLQAVPHAIYVRYVLDMAEIPTFSAMRAATPDGKMTPDQLDAWGRTEAQTLAPELHFAVDGRLGTFEIDHIATSTRPGAGGLPTLYLVLDGHVPIAGKVPSNVEYRDTTFAGRLGWRDVVVAPQTEPTHELTAYPSALIGSPRATSAVSIGYSPSGVATVNALDTGASQPGSGGVPSLGRSNQLSDMLSRGTSDWSFVALVFVTAIFLGALHALEPGHGKTLLAISLVGARATVKQAAILAAALTVAHTIGVLALGVAINLFKGYFVPESIYPWITLLSGIAIAIIGARAVQRQILARRPLAHAHAHSHAATHPHEHEHVHEASGAHSHGPGGHSHSHADGHVHDDLEHARAHAIPGTAPLTFGGTVWAAMSGGVAPCPAALVVLLTALAVNEVVYGIFVIIAFSVGLALTLTTLGIAVVRGATWLQNRPKFDRFVTYGPLISAGFISTIGAIMVGQGFAQQGVSISPLLITAVVALAIVGYAFSHPFAHRRTEVA